VSGDIGGGSARRTLKPKFYQSTENMVTAGIPPSRNIPTLEPGIEPGTS